VVADFVTVQVPSQSLAAVTRPDGMRTRRATLDDVDAIRRVYDAWAREQNGPLSRRGASFTASAADFLAQYTGVTLAVDAGDVVHGYASWHRGASYGETGVLQVDDLLAVDADGYRGLLNAMGSFSSVTPLTKIDTSGDDVARLFLSSLHWQVVDTNPYMLKILDVSGALSLRGYPQGFSGELAFRVTGSFESDQDSGYILDVSSGRGNCVRAEHGGRVFTQSGLALMFAGTQSSANLRSVGHLSGGVPEDDSTWDALFGGQQQHIRNYF
jgi:predicted acetyltransferase